MCWPRFTFVILHQACFCFVSLSFRFLNTSDSFWELVGFSLLVVTFPLVTSYKSYKIEKYSFIFFQGYKTPILSFEWSKWPSISTMDIHGALESCWWLEPNISGLQFVSETMYFNRQRTWKPLSGERVPKHCLSGHVSLDIQDNCRRCIYDAHNDWKFLSFLNLNVYSEPRNSRSEEEVMEHRAFVCFTKPIVMNNKKQTRLVGPKAGELIQYFQRTRMATVP